MTEADRDAELAIRDAASASAFPTTASSARSGRTRPAPRRFAWIIDPIDGTRAFITGVPVWGTLIGLMVDGRPSPG